MIQVTETFGEELASVIDNAFERVLQKVSDPTESLLSEVIQKDVVSFVEARIFSVDGLSHEVGLVVKRGTDGFNIQPLNLFTFAIILGETVLPAETAGACSIIIKDRKFTCDATGLTLSEVDTKSKPFEKLQRH